MSTPEQYLPWKPLTDKEREFWLLEHQRASTIGTVDILRLIHESGDLKARVAALEALCAKAFKETPDYTARPPNWVGITGENHHALGAAGRGEAIGGMKDFAKKRCPEINGGPSARRGLEPKEGE